MQHQRIAVLWSALSAFILVASISCITAFAQHRSETVWPKQGWQTSTPEEQGMSSAALAKLLDFPHEVYSAPKAVIGTLAAIAYKDGLLDSLNRSALEFFPEHSVTQDPLGGRGIVASDDTWVDSDDKWKAITIQNLSDMTSGMDWTDPSNGGSDTFTEMKRSSDWIRFIFDGPMSTTPGDIFNYNSDNLHLVSAIIAKLTGMSASAYAQAELFGPLRIGVSYWGHDPQGVTTGGNGLSLLPTRPAPKTTESKMAGGYFVIGMGVFALCVAFSLIRNARRYGFIMRGGRFVSPTAEPEMIKRYILGKCPIAVAGIFYIIVGGWLILSPETLLAILPQ